MLANYLFIYLLALLFFILKFCIAPKTKYDKKFKASKHEILVDLKQWNQLLTPWAHLDSGLIQIHGAKKDELTAPEADEYTANQSGSEGWRCGNASRIVGEGAA